MCCCPLENRIAEGLLRPYPHCSARSMIPHDVILRRDADENVKCDSEVRIRSFCAKHGKQTDIRSDDCYASHI